MKILYVLAETTLYSNIYSGVVQQAIRWKEGLEEIGHYVDFAIPHEEIVWENYDIVHFFQYTNATYSQISSIKKRGLKIVVSPIIDSVYGSLQYLSARLPSYGLSLTNHQVLRKTLIASDLTLARSTYEKNSIARLSSNINCKIATIPCDYSDKPSNAINLPNSKSEHIFHLSHISQKRKNVRRLVKAAISLKYPLRLAGSISDDDFQDWLLRIEKTHSNIKYLGRLSKQEVIDEMKTAKIFALPSIFEGVGLVALDAAYWGCHILTTSKGGPIDYLENHATYINPNSQRDLEGALQDLIDACDHPTSQQYIYENHLKAPSSLNLVDEYREICDAF